MFRPTLTSASLVAADGYQEMSIYSIYCLSKYQREGTIWRVSYCSNPMEFRCLCQRMESIGFSCEHMVVVLVKFNFTDLPNCLVLHRWSRCAKDSIRDRHVDGSIYWDS